MKKLTILVLILNPLIGYLGFGQQIQSNQINEIGSLQNLETFLNRKLINPTSLTDSNNFVIDFVFHELLIDNNKAPDGFFLSAEKGLGKCSVGINIDFNRNGLLENRSFISSVKYDLIIKTNSSLELGLNIGFWQTRIDLSGLMYSQDPLESFSDSPWQNNPVLDLGLNYKYKTQSFRLSYNNILNGPVNSTTFTGVILNYQNTLPLSGKITLSPDISGCINPGNVNGIIALKVDYNKKIGCGLLYNTKNSCGFLISGIVKRRVKIGYYYNLLSLDHQTFGSHCLNIGLILK